MPALQQCVLEIDLYRLPKFGVTACSDELHFTGPIQPYNFLIEYRHSLNVGLQIEKFRHTLALNW